MARKAQPVSGVYEKNEGSGIWYVRYRLQGHLVRKKIGSRSEAADYLKKIQYIRASGDGDVPASAKQTAKTAAEKRQEVKEGGEVTVATLCDLRLNFIKVNPKKFKDQANPPRRIGVIKKVFGHRAAASLKAYEITDWLASMNRAPATLNRYKTTFSAIYRYGKQRGKVEVNPARDAPSETVNSGIIRCLTKAEEDRLRKVLQADVDACSPEMPTLRQRAHHHIYELDVALGTGMRRGEQYNLRWQDVDLDERKLTVRNPKSGGDRVVYMNEDVAEAFKALKALPLRRKRRAADKPNNSAPDVVFALGDPKKWFASALKRARVKNFRWHDLRHSFCTRLAENGETMPVIMRAAGHKSTQTSMRYIHIQEETMRGAMTGLNRK